MVPKKAYICYTTKIINMKKIILLFLISFKISTSFSQGKQFIAKQDGLVMSMTVEYYNTLDNRCNFTKGDQYKVTVYFSNESGKKIISDNNLLPIVSFSGSTNDCDGNPNVFVSVGIPTNPGDIQKNVGYCIIKAGNAPSTINVNQYLFRGYKFVK